MNKLLHLFSFLLIIVVVNACFHKDELADVTIEIPDEYISIPYFYKIEFSENGVTHTHIRRDAPYPGKKYDIPKFIINNDTISFKWELNHRNPPGGIRIDVGDNTFEPIALLHFQSSDGLFFIEGKEYSKITSFESYNFKLNKMTDSDHGIYSIYRGIDDIAFSVQFNIVGYEYEPWGERKNDKEYCYIGKIDFSKKFVAWQESYEKQKRLSNSYRKEYIQ